MLFKIRKVSNEEKPYKSAKPQVIDNVHLAWGIEINSIAELIKLAEEVKKPLIISCHNLIPDIQIYDDNIE